MALLNIFDADSSSTRISSFAFTLLIFLAYFTLAYALIFRTEWVSKKLKLVESFDQEIISLNIHRSTILHIAVIVTGCLVVLNAFPRLLQEFFFIYQQRALSGGMTPLNFSAIWMDSLQILIGGLLIYQSKRVVNFIELRRRESHK